MENSNIEKYIPSLTDISDWEIKTYANTGGSRAKRIAVNPHDGQEYFVKGSKIAKDNSIRYPMEFWSEIASSKIGQFFGFNMLDYNISIHKEWRQKVGCISLSMVKHNENNLTEGKTYLTGYKPTYNPEKHKKDYTFQFIAKSLTHFKLDESLHQLVKVVILDALIGNSDRHQENWGFINHFANYRKLVKLVIDDHTTNFLLKGLFRLSLIFLKNEMVKINFLKSLGKNYINTFNLVKFSPIYDSGCCLGREKTDVDVIKLLNSKEDMEKYLRRGCSEIHWEGGKKKQNHFDLINKLKPQFNSVISETIQQISVLYKLESIQEIIYNLDKNLPNEYHNYKLSIDRKDLMIKLITLRAEKLKQLL